MSDTVIIAIVAIVPATISAIFAGIALLKSKEIHKEVIDVKDAVEQVHKLTNSRLTELVNASKDSGRQLERDVQQAQRFEKQDRLERAEKNK